MVMPINDDWDKAVTVVDDEPWMRDVLVRMARSWEYECQVAGNAEQALQLLQRSPTPVVITDLRMPGQGGIWLVREIQRRWPDTGIIVVTAGDDADAAAACLNAGANRYFLKPINIVEFRDALDATLAAVRHKRYRERHRRELERAVHRQTQRTRRTFLSAIDSLVRTLEARHPYTKGHSLRVQRYALRLADTIGLEGPLRRRLSLAAKLHDIGKVGTPEAILNKDGPLTDAEHAIIREHPVAGERILSPIIRNPAVLAAIRGHHERLDGQGYPDGLKGDQVPLLARIIAVVDTYDALTSSRAYRDALTPADALAELGAIAGTHLDPQLVHCFRDMMAQQPS
jgi:putative two-component system response regulator